MKVTLDKVLKEKGLTAYKLAKKVDISAYNISQLAKNKTNSISFATLEKLCAALECNITDILVLDKDIID